MNPQAENNSLFIRKLLLISFLFFVPFLFQHKDNAKESTDGKTVRLDQVFQAGHAAEQVAEAFMIADLKLIPGRPSKQHTLDSGNSAFAFAACRIEPVLRLCHDRFAQIKHLIQSFHSYPFRSSPDNGDVPLIS